MKLQKHSPERALRPQAGATPLHKGRSYTSPEGAAEGSVTPLGFIFLGSLIPGVTLRSTPVCGLFRPSAFAH